MSHTYLPPPNQHSSVAGIPAAALAAAIIWILFGAFMLLGGAALIVSGAFGFIQVLLGAAFVATAMLVILGRTASILGAGIATIIFGGLLLFGAAAMLSPSGNKPPSPGWMVASSFVVAGALVAAGILACVANRAYKAWRVARVSARDAAAAALLSPGQMPSTEPEAPQPWRCPS